MTPARAYWALGGLALALALVQRADVPTDYEVFATAGRSLWRGDLDAVYVNPWVLAGPLQLALAAAAHSLASFSAGLDVLAVHVVGTSAMALGVARTAGAVRRHAGLDRSPLVEAGTGALALLWGVATDPDALGHPAQVAVPLVWVIAGLAVRHERAGVAGALLGLSTALEPWGVLGAPLLLLADSPRRVAREVGWAAGACGVLWGPFLLAGRPAMLDMRWPLLDGTPAAAVFSGETFSTGMRLVQVAAALLAASAAALLARRSPHALWLVPATAVTARLWLEPAPYGYYWLAPATLALVGLGTWARRSSAPAALAGALAYLQVVAFGDVARTAVLAATTVVLAVTVAVVRRRPPAETSIEEVCEARTS